MSDEDAIIVRILAGLDAGRLPIRRWERKTAANRLAILKSGLIPFRMNSTQDSERKASERLLSKTAASGLIDVQRRPGKKFPLCKLTPLGEWRARAICGLPGYDVAVMITEKIGELTKRNPRTMDERWCSETSLNGGRGWGDDATVEDRRGLALTELDAMPAISLGWITARSTLRGNAYYAVTVSGLKQIRKPDNPQSFGRLPKFDREAATTYRFETDKALSQLNSDDPPWANELGEIPLPCAMQGVPINPVGKGPGGDETYHDEPHEPTTKPKRKPASTRKKRSQS